MKKFVQIGCRNICYMLAMFLLQSAVFADVNAAFFQDRMVSGNVTSSDDGEGIPGVNILVKGTTIGTVTDVDGNFSFSVPGGPATLVFSSVGFVTQERQVGDQSILNIVLSEDTRSLDEVVVVGYGTVRKSDLTGAVGSLKSEDFNQGVVTSPQDLMAGKISGVQIIQNSPEPGGGVSVNVRGVGTINAGSGPLYVIDGLPFEGGSAIDGGASGRTSRNPLASINPADQAKSPGYAIRKGHFKLVEHYDPVKVELFNLKEDIGEIEDLSASMPEKVKEMENSFALWLIKMNPVLHTENPNHL